MANKTKTKVCKQRKGGHLEHVPDIVSNLIIFIFAVHHVLLGRCLDCKL